MCIRDSPYYGDDGKLAFKHFPAHEILPFWADDDHTILDCAVRLYPQEVWSGYTKEIVERVEIFKSDGLYRYVYDGTTLTPDEQLGAVPYTHLDVYKRQGLM